MKKILFFTGMFVILGMTACGNRNNRDGTERDSVPMTPYDTPIDTVSRDSIDSIMPLVPVPITPME